MADYNDWNYAIINKLVLSVPKGAHIYLSVDDDLLNEIGEEFARQGTACDAPTWSEDFEEAVRAHCLTANGNAIAEKEFYERDGSLKLDFGNRDVPVIGGFLSAMVLAASRMAADDKITSKAYFAKLRQILESKRVTRGRPEALKLTGTEDRFWISWNAWLETQQYKTTAQPGNTQQLKHIWYSISQSLLRQGDRQHLREKLEARMYDEHWDRSALKRWLHDSATYFPKHLRELVHTRDKERYENLLDAVCDYYEQLRDTYLIKRNIRRQNNPSSITKALPQQPTLFDIDTDEPDALPKTSAPRPKTLDAGLFRFCDDLFGAPPEYYLYCDVKDATGLERSSILLKEAKDDLQWIQCGGNSFRSSWMVSLAGDQVWEVDGDEDIHSIRLPRSNFHLLFPDPYHPYNGLFATWQKKMRPEEEEPFLLLCNASISPLLEALQREKLLSWTQTLPLSGINEGWTEYQQCRVHAGEWFVPTTGNDALRLIKLLQPRQDRRISLRNGLRAPNGTGWLEGFGPDIILFGDTEPLQVKVYDEAGRTVADLGHLSSEQGVPCPILQRGSYWVGAGQGAEILRKAFSMASWNDLEITTAPGNLYTDLGAAMLVGANLRHQEAVTYQTVVAKVGQL